MRVFITGIDTHIGKTLVSSWLCLHTGYSYFKPIQTGCEQEKTDTQQVQQLAQCPAYSEVYCYKVPVSPHLAAHFENQQIDPFTIVLPDCQHLIVEGAGGLLVPLNHDTLMIDLIKQLHLPVILVASCRLGAINHTLLSLQALRLYHLPVLGVIISGEKDPYYCDALTTYGKVSLLGHLPFLPTVTREVLKNVPLGASLSSLLI
jgi:dethiobiotin synthetase